jgi:hypothetical protein
MYNSGNMCFNYLNVKSEICCPILLGVFFLDFLETRKLDQVNVRLWWGKAGFPKNLKPWSHLEHVVYAGWPSMLVGNYLAGARYVVSFNRMDLISSAYAELGLSFIFLTQILT